MDAGSMPGIRGEAARMPLPRRETMLMVVFPRNLDEEVVEALQQAGVEGYTIASGWHGLGDSGPVLGSTAWPGENGMIFTAVTHEQAEDVAARVRAVHDRRRATLPGSGMAVFAFPCTQML